MLVLKQVGEGSTLISLTIRVWVIKERSDGAQSLAIVGCHVLTLAGKVLRGRLQVGLGFFQPRLLLLMSSLFLSSSYTSFLLLFIIITIIIIIIIISLCVIFLMNTFRS